jgi:hypothetical protein
MRNKILFLFLIHSGFSSEKIFAQNPGTGIKEEGSRLVRNMETGPETNRAIRENYVKESYKKIKANHRTLEDLRIRKTSDKKVTIMANQKKLIDLETRNWDLKQQIENQNTTNEDQWEKFRARFDQDMEDLEKAIANLKLKMNPKEPG